MSTTYDVIVIGAGHNGLTTAALLAKKGRKVLILEARERIGGLAGGEEFHPGYRHAGLLHDTTGVRPWVVKELDLEGHGLARRAAAALFAPEMNGPGLVLGATTDSAETTPTEGLSAADAESFAGYAAFLQRVAPVLRKTLDQQPPNLVETGAGDLLRLGLSGLALRRLGKADMMEILRIVPMPVADWLDEWFASDLLKAALAGPAVFSTTTGPRSPGSNANLLLSAAAASTPIEGGGQALVAALERAARAQGVEIRTNATVEKLILDGNRVTGVEVSGSGPVAASAVAASCDPKQVLLDLLPPASVGQSLGTDLIHFRSRGTAAKMLLALSAYPEFSSRPGRQFERLHIGESLDEIERAADAVKYRRFSDKPILDISFPTVESSALAPSGHHVASILVSFAPFELEGGWTDESRQGLLRSVMDTLETYAPGMESLVVGSEVLSPADLATEYRLPQGHLFHGEHAIDQLVLRPSADCARYRTPFEGLYLCGSGSHPGGGLTCVPGALAARVIDKSF